MRYIRKCVACHDEFKTRLPQQIYCPKCAGDR